MKETILKVGDKARGFEFEDNVDNIIWISEKNNYIGKIGEITHISSCYFFIKFEDGNNWRYPISLMHLAVVDQPQVIEIDLSKVEKMEYLYMGKWAESVTWSATKYRFTLKDENKIKIQQEIEELEAKINELRKQL